MIRALIVTCTFSTFDLIADKTLEPEWDEQVLAKHPIPKGTSIIKFEVLDEDTGEEAEAIGTAETKLPKDVGKSKRLTLDLNPPGSGTIEVVILKESASSTSSSDKKKREKEEKKKKHATKDKKSKEDENKKRKNEERKRKEEEKKKKEKRAAEKTKNETKNKKKKEKAEKLKEQAAKLESVLL